LARFGCCASSHAAERFRAIAHSERRLASQHDRHPLWIAEYSAIFGAVQFLWSWMLDVSVSNLAKPAYQAPGSGLHSQDLVLAPRKVVLEEEEQNSRIILNIKSRHLDN
jgi:hypothetical protein